ncbi:MAG: LytR/AlgR family response regulator transcription factor [Chitinophagaceae bacterium]
MTTIKAIIVDDELGNIETLTSIITKYCKNIVLCGTATTNEAAEKLIFEVKPQLAFLDIQLQNETTFQLLQNLSTINFEIIFITAYNQFAINAIKFSAIDYLLKPINIDDLKLAVSKAIISIESKDAFSKINNLISNLSITQPGLKKIGIITYEGMSFVEIDNIIRLKAEGSYTKFYLKNGTVELTSKNLKEYEDILPKHQFCRIHNSHLINLNFIKKYQKGRGGFVVMEDDTEIEVSHRKKTEFLQMISNF